MSSGANMDKHDLKGFFGNSGHQGESKLIYFTVELFIHLTHLSSALFVSTQVNPARVLSSLNVYYLDFSLMYNILVLSYCN